MESTPGKGTTATLYLPRVTPEDELNQEEVRLSTGPRPLNHADLKDATLLVVDDDDDVRAVTCAQLEDMGYTTIAASSGAAALILIDERSSINAVLSDVVMPVMDGLALAAMLRRVRPGLPILFMTGYADRQRLVGEDVLDKPFTITDLANGIRALLIKQDAKGR